MKGKAQVEQDVYDALRGFIEGEIGGTLYQSDTRPLDSKAEDAVIVASTPSPDQFQKGRVRILIFVPDIDCGIGRSVPDLERVQQLEQIADPILELLNDTLLDYAFEFFTAPGDGREPQASEHFINIHLQYTRINF